MDDSGKEMSFLQHLEELRKHLMRVIIAVLIIGAVAFLMKDFIFEYIIFAQRKGNFPTYKFFCQMGIYFGSENDFCKETLPFVIQNRTMTGQFSASIWVSFWSAIVLGFPYMMYEVWRFIAPGLYEHERKQAKGFIGITSLLFFVGVLFGYYVISPLSVHFFMNFNIGGAVENSIDIDSYIDMLRSSVISCGIVFELPVVIYFLSKLGIITPSLMRTYRKYAIVLTLTIAAIITPPDVVSQIVVSIPIFILYEISIFISAWAIRNKT